MAATASVLFFFFPLIFYFAVAAAQLTDCSAQSFSGGNGVYALCSSLNELGATLHWTYHPSNGIVDVAFRVPQSSDGWAGWAINPSSSGMIGANAFLAYHDSTSGVVEVITTVLQSTSPTIKNESLTFPVYSSAAEYSGSSYTIYASLGLPSNKTEQSTVYQAGQTFSGGLPYGHPTSGDNVLTANQLNFLSGQSASQGVVTPDLHRKNIHGLLNAISWGTLLPLGVMIARYLRMFESADPAWFYLHITCQCSGYVLGVSGWALGIKLRRDAGGLTYQPHFNIAIALFCLATLQVSALLLRPHKENKYRIYWNIYHHSVGFSVVILSVINVFKGFDILEPPEGWKQAYIAVISTLGGVAIALEVIKLVLFLQKRSWRRRGVPSSGGHELEAGSTNGGGGMKAGGGDQEYNETGYTWRSSQQQ